jgi:hypothetical protein
VSYKANILLSCLSKPTLQAICTMGLSNIELGYSDIIIDKFRERCNAGRNCHVWRQQFALRIQREKESVDSWVCELRELAQKCEFNTDCCNKCQDTRLLGQIIYGVHSDKVRRKLLQEGATLSLNQALTTLRTAEATLMQAANLRQNDPPSIQQIKNNTARTDSKSAARSRKSSKPEAAGSIVIGSILPGELIETSVSPADSDTPTAVLFLPDTGASIDAVPHALHLS